jgi:hypothetical protein
MSTVLLAACGVGILASSTSPWPQLMVQIVSNMMGREAELYGGNSDNNDDDAETIGTWHDRCHYAIFDNFKRYPVASVKQLYQQMHIPMTNNMEVAL